LRRRIESDFPVDRRWQSRAVAGISMGGFGAVKLALKRPDLYSAAGSLSGALAPLDWPGVQEAPLFVRPTLKRVFGRTESANNLADNDLRRLMSRPWRPRDPRPRFLLRCGQEDKYQLDQAASRTYDQLSEAGFTADLTLEPGGHNWRYWRQSVVELVAWHAERFQDQQIARSRGIQVKGWSTPGWSMSTDFLLVMPETYEPTQGWAIPAVPVASQPMNNLEDPP
jgi:S-formylglutathione hydrolase FrmB